MTQEDSRVERPKERAKAQHGSRRRRETKVQVRYVIPNTSLEKAVGYEKRGSPKKERENETRDATSRGTSNERGRERDTRKYGWHIRVKRRKVSVYQRKKNEEGGGRDEKE